MKVAIALFALVALSVGAPPTSNDKDAQVLSDNIGVDGFSYGFETSNGIAQQETENEAIAVRGKFQYVGSDGVTYSISRLADENGLQPSGAHLLVAPQ